MGDTKLAPITGVARPSRRLRRIATALHGPGFAGAIDSMLEDAVAVNALAGAIERALVAGTSRGGRVDLQDTALHLIRELRRNQR